MQQQIYVLRANLVGRQMRSYLGGQLVPSLAELRHLQAPCPLPKELQQLESFLQSEVHPKVRAQGLRETLNRTP